MWMRGIPIPPSLNQAYPTLKNGRRGKSLELVQWEKEFTFWAYLRNAELREVIRHFENPLEGQFLSINCVYYFRRDRVIGKKGQAKRLDADNRLKILIDAVTRLIFLDDCLIWQGGFYKRIALDGKEHCDVDIKWIRGEDIPGYKNAMATP